jgi:hypothetical protein
MIEHAFEGAGFVVGGELLTMVALASFMPRISTSVPSRRNLSTTLSSAPTAVRSQKWAWKHR